MGTNLFVGNLPYSMTDQELSDLFSQAGEVVSAQIIFDKMTQRSRGFGFVEMKDEAGASEAIQRFNQNKIMGRALTVNEAKPRTERPDEGGWGGR